MALYTLQIICYILIVSGYKGVQAFILPSCRDSLKVINLRSVNDMSSRVFSPSCIRRSIKETKHFMTLSSSIDTMLVPSISLPTASLQMSSLHSQLLLAADDISSSLQLMSFLPDSVSPLLLSGIISGSFLIFKFAVYSKMQFVTASMVSCIPVNSKVVEIGW